MSLSPAGSTDGDMNVRPKVTMVSAFEEHPEGFTPRVFTTTGNNVYELLKNGCVVPRPSLPPQTATWDWWYIKTDSWSTISFNRALTPMPVVPEEVWQALRDAEVDIEKLTGASEL